MINGFPKHELEKAQNRLQPLRHAGEHELRGRHASQEGGRFPTRNSYRYPVCRFITRLTASGKEKAPTS